MKVMEPKIWSSLLADMERHPAFVHMEHLFASRRFWAVVSMAVILALLLAVVIMLVMFSFWVAGAYLSRFDLTPIL